MPDTARGGTRLALGTGEQEAAPHKAALERWLLPLAGEVLPQLWGSSHLPCSLC